MPVVSLQVPENAAPGDTLEIFLDGNRLEIPVPENSVAGDILQVQVGEDSNDEIDQTSSIKIQTAGGECLTIFSSESDNGELIEDCDGTCSFPWRAGLVLADFLSQSPLLDVSQGSKVLELGCGLGITGLCFGSYFRKRIEQLTLTDCASELELLHRNVSQNRSILPKTEIANVKWSADPALLPGNRYDWIIGSDLLYNTDSIPVLVKTIEALLVEGGNVLFSVRWRKPESERLFFETLQSGKHRMRWKLLHGQSETPWSEYGSHRDSFFRRTMIGVNGRPKPLGTVGETDIETMTREEYDAWDSFQVQVYLGHSSAASQDTDT